MFVDAEAFVTHDRLAAGACLVGAGAAGITIAMTLADAGVDVVLLESGGFEREAATQRLYDTIDRDARYPFAETRLRYFGGSTNHWGGLCRPLDREDFLPRPWIADSGWPLDRSEIEPYHARALSLVDIPRLYALDDLDREHGDRPYLVARDDPELEPLVWLQSPPTRMGARYRDRIRQHPRIRCVLHANAVDVLVNHAGDHVTGVRAKTLGGRTLTVAAKCYTLSAGAIENARLLLLSDAVVPGGLGNRYDLVGRYLMTHFGRGGVIVLVPPGDGLFREECLLDCGNGVSDRFFGWAVKEPWRRRFALLGCSLNAYAVPRNDALRMDGRAVPRAVLDLLTASAWEPPLQGPLLGTRSYVLAALAEQSPNRESRVLLGSELDALGQRRTVVDLRIREADATSVQRSIELLAGALARRGQGRLRLEPEGSLEMGFAPEHHIGTTRMADDPRRGVTDRHGRVHGVDNLYVAGSSLFPTAGFANPTLTILALALRQAEHLRDGVQ